jgi:hypothetical protein
MEPNKIEKQFKEQLNSREIKPSEMAWVKLDAMLTAVDKKPKRNFRWAYVAASIFGFLLVGTVYFNRFETVEINKDKPIVLEQKIDVDTLDKPGIIKEGVANSNIQKTTTKLHSVVAGIKNRIKYSKQLENKEEKVSAINHSKEDNAVVASPENRDYHSTATNKYISAEKLLAEVSDTKFETKEAVETIEKKRKAISVNPNDLLLNAETELNQSFRESALDRFNKNFKAVKTAIVNRNYEE